MTRINTLTAHLKKAGESNKRYPDRLFTWSGKDADLDPGGDWWIERVIDGFTNQTDEATECVVVVLKGRKIFSNPATSLGLEGDAAEAASQEATEIVCDAVAGTGCTMDADQDGWYLSAELRVGVPWKYRPDGRINFPSTCRGVLKLAEQAADEYSKTWQDVDNALEAQYSRLTEDSDAAE